MPLISVVLLFIGLLFGLQNNMTDNQPINFIKGNNTLLYTKIDIETIVNTTAEYFNISPEEITGDCRKKEISLPRHIAIYLCRKFLELPYESIGEFFSGRNHTTIMHATNKIGNDIKSNLTVVKAINKIKRDLGL